MVQVGSGGLDKAISPAYCPSGRELDSTDAHVALGADSPGLRLVPVLPERRETGERYLRQGFCWVVSFLRHPPDDPLGCFLEEAAVIGFQRIVLAVGLSAVFRRKSADFVKNPRVQVVRTSCSLPERTLARLLTGGPFEHRQTEIGHAVQPLFAFEVALVPVLTCS